MEGQRVENLERLGPRVRFEKVDGAYGAYWRVSRVVGGGRSGFSLGKDAEKARAKWESMKDGVRCRECGDPPLGNWIESTQKELTERGLCLWCNTWTETTTKREDPNSVRVNGYYYTIGKKPSPATPNHCLGHAGARFVIRFRDGREVETNNLWAAGDIPEHFRERLPDNAEFVQREKRHGYVGHGSASV